MSNLIKLSKEEESVKVFQTKKLITYLDQVRGDGTSLISLIISPKDQISRVLKMLQNEYGTASNIKSHTNRLSVLSAITMIKQRLKLYNKCPTNGLIMYGGMGILSDGNEKRLNIDFEPFRPINTSLYMCDNKFHTEVLRELIQDNDSFGFIIVDGNGALYGTIVGNTRKTLHKFSVDLPKKHSRGGQSAQRFGRIRLEKRQHYILKVAEIATQQFITNDCPNISKLVLAGSADLKNELNRSDIFDKRLQEIVIKVVDVSYGGANGFTQAIELASDTLANVKFVQEKQLICKYLKEIAMNSDKYCFGIGDTMKALELGAVETLILWEELPHYYLSLRNIQTGELSNKIVAVMDQNIDMNMMEVVKKELLVEWLADNYKTFGTTLEFITDRSQEGSQFCKGFGGIGGLLRWPIDFTTTEYLTDSDDDLDDDLFM